MYVYVCNVYVCTHIKYVYVCTVYACIHLKNMCVYVSMCLASQSCLTVGDSWAAAHPAPLSWNSPGKNPGVGSHSLLQGSF